MITYKGTHSDLKCRDFQYEIGKTFKHSGELTLCCSGFHSCRFPVDCLDYYNDFTDRYFKVEATGDINGNAIEDDSKVVSSKIKFIKEVTITDLIKTSIHNIGKHKKDKYVDTPSFYIPKKKFETTSHVDIKYLLNNKHHINIVAFTIDKLYNIGCNCRFKADFQVIYSVGDDNFFQHTLKNYCPRIYIEGNQNRLILPKKFYTRKDFTDLSTSVFVIGDRNIVDVDNQRVYIDGYNNRINILDSSRVDFSDRSNDNEIIIKGYTPTLIINSKHPVEIKTGERSIVTQGKQRLKNLIPQLV